MKDYFTCNLDESSFLASDGIIRVIGNSKKRKHEKNIADSRDSITIVRVGSAGGVDGPRIYLAKGQRLEYECLINFCKHHDAPPGSCVEMTPNAYMTTEAWRKICPNLCKGIRNMEVIVDHPDWWVVLSLDGFGSHLDPPSLVEFAKYKIMVLKEEDDTSQVYQAYDQKVVKDDKRWSRKLLDGYTFHVKNTITQWELILVVNTEINKFCKGDAWKLSFVKVKLYPSQRLPFKVWV